MTEHENPGQAVTILMGALNWAYDQAASNIPGLGSAEDLANSHLASCKGSVEEAIDDLIRWQVSYAGAAGFVSNLGGIITMPIAIPANLASSLLIQLRMVASIAYLRGYEISDERVRTMAFVCLTGSAGATILQEFGVSFGTKLSTRMIMQISGATLTKINQAVGFRLVTKAGTTGLINLTKIVPFIGGLVGGGFDAVVTSGIGSVAKQIFKPVGKVSSPESMEPEPPTAIVELASPKRLRAVRSTKYPRPRTSSDEDLRRIDDEIIE